MLALAALIVAAVSVFAVYNNREGVDDPAENPVVLAATSTPRTSIVPEITASPAESSESVSSSPDSAASSPAPTPKPDLRFLEQKRYMLELINEARVQAGVDPVTLGENVAAQLHAEASLENCFSSHWGIDGLKPYMRYSLADGYQSNGENISGLSYCIRASDGYRRIGTVEREIREAMNGLMASPGHRDNILDKWHRRVNIGLAWDRYNISLVQHFEGDYVEYERLPEIEYGVLRLSGTTRNGVTFGSDDDLGVQIYFDPPTHTLTAGQVSRTYCYDQGRLIAALRPPLSGDWDYDDDGFDEPHQPCPDPYDVSPEASAPVSHDEALEFWQEAYQASLTAPVEHLRVPWITASEMTVRDHSFSLTADLRGLLAHQGDGVYTVMIWGSMDGEDIVISQYSIFYATVPPRDYNRTDRASFAVVSAGRDRTCGVKTDGSVECWGRPKCWAKDDDSTECFGMNANGDPSPLDDSLISVSVGLDNTCGLNSDGTIRCWGPTDHGEATPPSGSFSSVSVGFRHTCGVKTDGSVACWGNDADGQSTPPDGTSISVSAGGAHTCGVKTDGSVVCWGYNADGESTPPGGSFVSVSAGWSHTCGVKAQAEVACWGDNTTGEATPPDGPFASVSAGYHFSCGVKPSGLVVCWGNDHVKSQTPPDTTFVSVSAGWSHSCGLRPDGSVECWGQDYYGESTPPKDSTSNP